MKTHGYFSVLSILVMAAITAAAFCQRADAQRAEIQEVAGKIPSDANAVLLVNVGQIRESQMANMAKWFESLANKFESGMGFIPANTDLVLAAANVDQRTFFPKWTVSLMATRAIPMYESISKAREGKADQALGQKFAALPNDMYVFPMDKNWLACYMPAERQHFVQWLRQLQRPATVTDSFLHSAIGDFDQAGNSLLFAVDLQHTYSPTRIFSEVSDAEFLKEQNIDPKQFAKLVSSVTGFSLAANIDEQIHTEIKISFADEITSIAPVAHELMLQILENGGVVIPETVQWKPSVQTNSILLSGTVGVSSFRRIISLLDTPEHDLTIDVANTEEFEKIYSDPARATKMHFESVRSLIRDLRNHGLAGQNFATNAIWFEKFADRIQRLQIHNVDPLVLAFSDNATKVLIDTATKLRIYGEEAKQETSRLWAARGQGSGGGRGSDFSARSFNPTRSWYGAYGRRGRYGYYGGNTGLFERRYAVQKIASAATVEIEKEFDELQKGMVDLRRSLTEKYDMEF